MRFAKRVVEWTGVAPIGGLLLLARSLRVRWRSGRVSGGDGALDDRDVALELDDVDAGYALGGL